MGIPATIYISSLYLMMMMTKATITVSKYIYTNPDRLQSTPHMNREGIVVKRISRFDLYTNMKLSGYFAMELILLCG